MYGIINIMTVKRRAYVFGSPCMVKHGLHSSSLDAQCNDDN